MSKIDTMYRVNRVYAVTIKSRDEDKTWKNFEGYILLEAVFEDKFVVFTDEGTEREFDRSEYKFVFGEATHEAMEQKLRDKIAANRNRIADQENDIEKIETVIERIKGRSVLNIIKNLVK